MSKPDSRTEILAAIFEIEERKSEISRYLRASMPLVIIEVLTTESADLKQAIKSLQYVLDTNYMATCSSCGRDVKLENIGDEAICECTDSRKIFDTDYATGFINLSGEPKSLFFKKENAVYWDRIEGYVRDAFLAVAKEGDVIIYELKDPTDIKEITQLIMDKISTEFPDAEWPYVSADF